MHPYVVSTVDHSENHTAPDAGLCIRFHDFELQPARRRLMCEGRPIGLSERGFDLLLDLVSKSGSLVSNQELKTRLWPHALPEESVDECLLWLEIAAVRQALGPAQHLLRTVPGRGYVFDAAETVLPGDVAWPPRSDKGREPGHDTRRKVVVIDDDQGICEALRGLLRSAGLRVDCYGSVSQFVASERSSLPGCLVLDVRLPGQSGLDFLEDLAKAEMVVPVIVMTGYADVPMTVRAMKAGAIEFLIKPVLPQRLLNAIQFAIEAAPSRAPALGWFQSTDPEQRNDRGGLAPWQEKRAKEAVANGLSTDLSIGQVASECGMSRGHFARAFKQSTGATPHEWLTRQRVEKAKGLMLEGVGLAEVALLCGFADQSHFSRVFARAEGRPPGAWQRRERHWTNATE